jgi:hypothetical protein
MRLAVTFADHAQHHSPQWDQSCARAPCLPRAAPLPPCPSAVLSDPSALPSPPLLLRLSVWPQPHTAGVLLLLLHASQLGRFPTETKVGIGGGWCCERIGVKMHVGSQHQLHASQPGHTTAFLHSTGGHCCSSYVCSLCPLLRLRCTPLLQPQTGGAASTSLRVGRSWRACDDASVSYTASAFCCASASHC